MTVVPRDEIKILDSNIPQIEEGIEVYDPTKTYKTNDKVQVNGEINRIYKAFKEVPVDMNPVDDVDASTGKGSFWKDSGATNYMRAFDELGSSTCTNAENIYYKFDTSDVDAIYLGSLKATSVRIKIVNVTTGSILHEETYETMTREVVDWQEWLTAPMDFQRTFHEFLPYAYATTMEVWINNPQVAEVGHIAFGRSRTYSITMTNPKLITSRRGVTSKTRDEFGNIQTRRKARYRRLKVNCLVATDATEIFENRMETIVDTPCVFIGLENQNGVTTLYGEMKDYDLPVDIASDFTQYVLEIEGYL